MFVGTLALGELHLDNERHKHPDHFVHKHQDNTLFHSTPTQTSSGSPERSSSMPSRSPPAHSPGQSHSPLATFGGSWLSWRSPKDGTKGADDKGSLRSPLVADDAEERDDTPGGPALGSPVRQSSYDMPDVSPARAPSRGEVPGPPPILQPTPSRSSPQPPQQGSSSKLGSFLGALASPRTLPWTVPGVKAAGESKERGGKDSVKAQTWSHNGSPPGEDSTPSPASLSTSPNQRQQLQGSKSPAVSPSVPLPKMLNAIDYHPPSQVCAIQ